MLNIECQCGNLKLVANKKPSSITRCNCSICNRLGALWAYYGLEDVNIVPGEEPDDTFSWGEGTIIYHRCSICGCTTHYMAIDDDGSDLVALNCRMAPGTEISNISIREFDGLNAWKYSDE
jgi:hypothetical protein